jgi:hypothetical protein
LVFNPLVNIYLCKITICCTQISILHFKIQYCKLLKKEGLFYEMTNSRHFFLHAELYLRENETTMNIEQQGSQSGADPDLVERIRTLRTGSGSEAPKIDILLTYFVLTSVEKKNTCMLTFIS